MSREPISKKLRFEVFKRDAFACQYCGARAPEVILHADHIKPVFEGGTTDILNLITACFDCNSGKGKREISDEAALSKQLDQMTTINDKRKQIEMMAEWRAELERVEDVTVGLAEAAWDRAIEGTASLTNAGRKTLAATVKRHGLEAVYLAISATAASYLKLEDDGGGFSMDSIHHAFDMIPRIVSFQKRSKDKPWMVRLYYARGILKNRLHYLNEHVAIQLMDDAVSYGADPEKIVELCKLIRNWTEFQQIMNDFVLDGVPISDNEDADGSHS